MKKEKLKSLLILSLFCVAVILSIFSFLKESKIKKSIASSPIPSFKKDYIAVIYISGTISSEHHEGFGLESFTENILDQIKQCEEDKRIKGVVIRINSPGGTVGATQEIYSAILELKKKRNIPVVSSICDIGTSGAYYIACATDKIIANPGSIVGSIGVIMVTPSIKGLTKKLGINFEGRIIKSGKWKDIGSIFRDMTEEERAYLQTLVDSTYQQFLEAVKKSRKEMPPELIQESAQGQIFNGTQAKEIGLVDKLGNFDTAIEEVCELAGIKGTPQILKLGGNPLLEFFSQIGMKFHFFSFSPLFKWGLWYLYYPGL